MDFFDELSEFVRSEKKSLPIQSLPVYSVYMEYSCSCGGNEKIYKGKARRTKSGLDFLFIAEKDTILSPIPIYLPVPVSRCSSCFPTVLREQLLAILSHDFPDPQLFPLIQRALAFYSNASSV